MTNINVLGAIMMGRVFRDLLRRLVINMNNDWLDRISKFPNKRCNPLCFLRCLAQGYILGLRTRNKATTDWSLLDEVTGPPPIKKHISPGRASSVLSLPQLASLYPVISSSSESRVDFSVLDGRPWCTTKETNDSLSVLNVAYGR